MKNLVLRPARLPRTLGQRNGAPRPVRNASRTKAHYQPISVTEGLIAARTTRCHLAAPSFTRVASRPRIALGISGERAISR
jgi:hypothetical protein